MTKTACMVAFNTDGKVLAATRRNQPDQWCFPGGKVEANETIQQAVIREFKEETNVTVSEKEVKLVYQGQFNEDCEASAFFVSRFIDADEVQQMEDGIAVEFVDISLLLKGPFADSIRQILDQLIKKGMIPVNLEIHLVDGKVITKQFDSFLDMQRESIKTVKEGLHRLNGLYYEYYPPSQIKVLKCTTPFVYISDWNPYGL